MNSTVWRMLWFWGCCRSLSLPRKIASAVWEYPWLYAKGEDRFLFMRWKLGLEWRSFWKSEFCRCWKWNAVYVGNGMPRKMEKLCRTFWKLYAAETENDPCRGFWTRVFIGDDFMPRFSNATVRVVMPHMLKGANHWKYLVFTEWNVVGMPRKPNGSINTVMPQKMNRARTNEGFNRFFCVMLFFPLSSLYVCFFIRLPQ